MTQKFELLYLEYEKKYTKYLESRLWWISREWVKTDEEEQWSLWYRTFVAKWKSNFFECENRIYFFCDW